MFSGHNYDTHLHMNNDGTRDSSLPSINGNMANENYCYTNGTEMKGAGYCETRDEAINGDTTVSYSRLFVWSSYDQGKYTDTPFHLRHIFVQFR